MKNYYRRWDGEGKQFFVDGNGNTVDEATALAGSLPEEQKTTKQRRAMHAAESDAVAPGYQPVGSRPAEQAEGDTASLAAAYQKLGLSEAEARVAAGEPMNMEQCARKLGMPAGAARAFADSFKD